MAKSRTITIGEEDEEDERAETTFDEHPLFPLEGDQRGFDISYIQITRFEEGMQKWGPCVRGEELRSEADIIERYGGGQYVLVGRRASKIEGIPGRISKNRRVNLSGLPKPLSADPTPAEARLSSPGTSQNGATTQAPSAGNIMGTDPMAFLTLMLEKERLASEKAQQQQNQFMQMFMTIMQGSKTDSQNMMQMMMTMSAQQQQGMMQFITAMLANKSGGPEEVARYAELINALSGNKDKKPGGEGEGGQSIGAMLENAADVIQGIVQLKASATAPPQALPNSESRPTGGAASLLAGLGRR